jgi:aspartate/glutamate racemase
MNKKTNITTLAIIGDTRNTAVPFYYNHIKKLIANSAGHSENFECILYSCKFESLDDKQDEDQIEENWHINAAKLANCWISVASNGANTLVFCDPILHLLLNKEVLFSEVIDLTDAIILSFLEKKIKKAVCFGVKNKFESEYFFEVIRRGIDLSKIDEIFNRCQNDHEKIDFIRTLPERGIQAILLHEEPEIEEFFRTNKISIPIFTTWEIHASAVAKFYLDILS